MKKFLTVVTLCSALTSSAFAGVVDFAKDSTYRYTKNEVGHQYTGFAKNLNPTSIPASLRTNFNLSTLGQILAGIGGAALAVNIIDGLLVVATTDDASEENGSDSEEARVEKFLSKGGMKRAAGNTKNHLWLIPLAMLGSNVAVTERDYREELSDSFDYTGITKFALSLGFATFAVSFALKGVNDFVSLGEFDLGENMVNAGTVAAKVALGVTTAYCITVGAKKLWSLLPEKKEEGE